MKRKASKKVVRRTEIVELDRLTLFEVRSLRKKEEKAAKRAGTLKDKHQRKVYATEVWYLISLCVKAMLWQIEQEGRSRYDPMTLSGITEHIREQVEAWVIKIRIECGMEFDNPFRLYSSHVRRVLGKMKVDGRYFRIEGQAVVLPEGENLTPLLDIQRRHRNRSR